MDIINYWGISTSLTNSDLEKFHENDTPIKNLFYLPILLKVNSLQILLFPNLQNSFLSPTLVSNVGLIDMIIDHQTIITDLKEDDYLFLLQWNGNTISDASWITSHDPLHYAPHLLLRRMVPITRHCVRWITIARIKIARSVRRQMGKDRDDDRDRDAIRSMKI